MNSQLKLMQKRPHYQCSFYDPKTDPLETSKRDPLFLELDISSSDISSGTEQSPAEKGRKLTMGEKIMKGMKQKRGDLID